ncbi:lysoplasmalogenase family protein [Microbacterium sp.]|uniref:lysoplasmalogenase family protein n=1 Tax=Microbacterium sp. TaxID=51671 RepID=UPI0039E66E22
MRRPLLLWAFAPYAVASTAHVVLLTIGSPLAAPTKLALMPLLAVPVLIAARRIKTPVTALLLTAIVFSWLGDGAGAFFPTLPELPLMLGFFGIAHITYIALFLRFLAEKRMPWWSLIYTAWWIAMISVIGPHAGGLLVALALYGLVLGGTAATSARARPLTIAGGAFFLVSDSILAFQIFLPAAVTPWGSPAVMLTYTLGQGLIVAGALGSARARRSR